MSSTKSDIRNAFFACIPILLSVVAEHRGFLLSFTLCVACAVAIILRSNQYWTAASYSPKKLTVTVLSIALLLSFLYEVNAWANAGKPTKRLFGNGQPHSAQINGVPNPAVKRTGLRPAAYFGR